MEELKAVLNSQLPMGERLLWARMFLLVGFKGFTGAQPDVAAVFDLNVWTFKAQLKGLRQRGAITVRSRYKKDRSIQVAGSRYELVHPDLWLPKAPEA